MAVPGSMPSLSLASALTLPLQEIIARRLIAERGPMSAERLKWAVALRQIVRLAGGPDELAIRDLARQLGLESLLGETLAEPDEPIQ